jgi:GntR family transcriptional repressor for pyruvate dehydrogenase complex
MFKQVGSKILLSKSVEQQIEQAIQQRKLAPGQKLPTEMQLCTSFGVSRTVMREALRMLSARGLITIQKGKGMFVRDFSSSSVTDPMRLFLELNYNRNHTLDVIHARQAIEPSIAAMAALHRKEEDLAKLKANLKDLSETQSGFEVLAALDQEFHMLLAKASGNPIIPLLMEPIHKLMPQIKSSVYLTVDDARQSAVNYHRMIIESVEQQDAEASRHRMEEHLKRAEEHALKMLAHAVASAQD